MIHEADPQSRPVIFIQLVRPSPLFKQNKILMKTRFATGETVGLAEWIIDDACLAIFEFNGKVFSQDFQKYRVFKNEMTMFKQCSKM